MSYSTHYVVVASVATTTDDGYETIRHLPTFYLDERSQGITSTDHACAIASEIANPFGDLKVYITAVKL